MFIDFHCFVVYEENKERHHDKDKKKVVCLYEV